MTVAVRIPSDITVRLMINAVAFAVAYSLFQTVAGACLSFCGTGIDRSTITGDCKIVQVDQSFVSGSVQKLRFEYLKQALNRSEVLRWFNFKFCKELINSYLFYGSSLLTFFTSFFGFSLGG